jgi:hypothetical protein
MLPNISPCVDESASGVTRAGFLSHGSWFPVVSWEAGSFQGKVQAFKRVVLHGETGSGMHFHLRETVFTSPWWIQGVISATITVVEVDKITTKGPLQWGFSSWTFHSFTQMVSPGL